MLCSPPGVILLGGRRGAFFGRAPKKLSFLGGAPPKIEVFLGCPPTPPHSENPKITPGNHENFHALKLFGVSKTHFK